MAKIQVMVSADEPVAGDASHTCLVCRRAWKGPSWTASGAYAHEAVGCHPIPAGATVFEHECACGTEWTDLADSRCPRCSWLPRRTIGKGEAIDPSYPHGFAARDPAAYHLPALEPGETHLFKPRSPRPWAATFDLKALALCLFCTDPRVQAIVNRVTDTDPPRHTKKARLAREKEEHPVCVWWSADEKALGFEELEKAVESLRGNATSAIVPAGQGDFEIIAPTNTPRQRRGRAFDVAWKNEHGGRVERAARHDAIRRAIAIARGLPR